MARFTKESLDTLRSRIDLAEVIGQHIELKRAGGAMKALCPFHEERSPSFVVNRGDQHFHCFGCGAHGDAIQFLMQHVRLSFSDAVQQLAERFGVQLDQVDGQGADVKRSNKARLKDALDAACRFYQAYLLYCEEGKIPLQYLFNRGVTFDFIDAFQVGLSPKNDGPLRKYMHDLGFSDEELRETGLIADRGGKMRDFFQERLMFPIHDAAGSCIGFSARKFQEATFGGKYINTSETPLFKKSRVLFGLTQSRRRIIKSKQAIIVEGGLDALRMIYNGFDLTVAALGTAFGEDHAQELSLLGVERVFLLFDGDTAGQEASIKVGNIFQKRAIEVHVAMLKDGEDPDSLLAKEGPLAITKALNDAEEYLPFLWRHYTKVKNPRSPAEKNKIVQEIVQRMRDWDNPVMVHESLKKLSALTQIPEELFGIDVLQSRTLHFKSSIKKGNVTDIDPDRILEQDLLRILLLFGNGSDELLTLTRKNIASSDLRNPLAKRLYEHLLDKGNVDFFSLVDEELEPFLSEILNKKVQHGKAKEQLLATIQRIKERNWMHERESIKMKIHSGKANDDELMLLVKQFDELTKQMPQVRI